MVGGKVIFFEVEVDVDFVFVKVFEDIEVFSMLELKFVIWDLEK